MTSSHNINVTIILLYTTDFRYLLYYYITVSVFYLLDLIIPLQDRQSDSSTFQSRQTDVGRLCADHVLT